MIFIGIAIGIILGILFSSLWFYFKIIDNENETADK